MDTYHPDTGHLREQSFEDPWLFIEAPQKRGSARKNFPKHCLISRDQEFPFFANYLKPV